MKVKPPCFETKWGSAAPLRGFHQLGENPPEVFGLYIQTQLRLSVLVQSSTSVGYWTLQALSVAKYSYRNRRRQFLSFETQDLWALQQPVSKKRTRSFGFGDGSSAVIHLHMYSQWSYIGNIYTTCFFLNIWLRTVVSQICRPLVCWASQQLLPIYELLHFCGCEWQLVKMTCHKGFSKILQTAHESFLRDSIKSHHFLFSFFTYRAVCYLTPATLWCPAFLAS